MDNGNKGKNFFQSFFLDPPDREEVFRPMEAPPPLSLLHDRLGHGSRDPGKAGYFLVPRPVDIHALPQKIPLPHGKGAAMPSPGGLSRRGEDGSRTRGPGGRNKPAGSRRLRGHKESARSAHIPYQNDQG